MVQNEEARGMSYLELRALLEIDWCDIAPPSTDTMAWLNFWAHLEDYLGLEISDDTLEIYNSTLPKEFAFRSLKDAREYVKRQLAIVDRWVEDSKYSGES